MLEERDQGGSHGHHLARGNVHELDVGGGNQHGLASTTAGTDQDGLFGETLVLVERSVGLCDQDLGLVVGGQVLDLIGNDALGDKAVRGLDETERVDASVGSQRTDQTNVRAFRSFDGAHTSVVGRVHVTDFHAGTVTGQTTRAKRGQAALVGQTRERVVLVHELGQLGSSEELLDGCHNGTDVDQGLRRDGLDVLGRHAFADNALHAGQAGADLVLDELADGADAAVAEVVDVIDLDAQLVVLAVALAREGLLAGVQRNQELDHGHDVFNVQDRSFLVAKGAVDAKLAVDLVTADLGQIVALGVEVQVVQQGLGSLNRGRLARSQLPVDVQQRVFAGLGGVLLQRGAHGVVLAELLEDLAFGPAEGLQQHGDGLLALAVKTDADLVALVDFELEPGAAGRDDLRGEDVLVAGLVGGALKVGARRADQLGDDDTLGAVDDEGALLGHQREVTHEHGLLLDFARVVVHELGLDVQRSRVRCVPVLALGHGVLGVSELRLGEAQGHGALEVLDRGDLFEDVGQTRGGGDAEVAFFDGLRNARLPAFVSDQPVKAVGLQGEQIRNVKRFVNLCE